MKLHDNMKEIMGLADQLMTRDNNIEEAIELLAEELPIEVLPSDVVDDYVFARQNLRNLIIKSDRFIDTLGNLAAMTESPRAYEVYAILIKTIIEANKDLMEIHKRAKSLQDPTESSPSSVTNALYIGSTADLQKLLKGKSDEAV